jgi:Fic family protein
MGISEIKNRIKVEVSIPTLNRDLKKLLNQGLLLKSGAGRNIVYKVSPTYQLLNTDIGNNYFEKDVDERNGNKKIDPAILELLESTSLFTENETTKLKELHILYQEKTKSQSPALLQKEIERLTIELSWKSSQIEGNTYSLLETELLLAEKQMAKDKDKSEAVMLLNHKTAMDYLYEHRIPLTPLKVAAIEDIHSLLIHDLGVSKNLRKRVVGITGTMYKPPDNEFQIREYLEKACIVINKKDFIYEKALLSVLLISLIQPFEDGNKRSARITANGILIENNYCPLSYRGVKPLDYKKAMILFYEQSNVSAFKQLFIEQVFFAVNNYF